MSLHFEERLARQCIAEVCLAYLLDLSHDLRAVKVEEDWPLAQYAARYWMTHAAQGGPNADGVRKLVWEFIQSERSHQISFGLYDPDRPWYEGDLNSSEEVEAPLLYHMAQGNVLCGVEKVLKDGADVNAQGGRYGNALFAASFKGHNEIVQILIDKGADVNAQGGYYGNALQAASLKGHNEIVQILVHNGVSCGMWGMEKGFKAQSEMMETEKKLPTGPRLLKLLYRQGSNVKFVPTSGFLVYFPYSKIYVDGC